MTETTVISVAVLRERFPEGSDLTPGNVREVLKGLGNSSALVGVETEALVQSILREWAERGSDLAWSPTGWKVNISGPSVHFALVAAIAWPVLGMIGLPSSIPVALVPGLLPYLFNIEKIRLTASEKEILARLPVKENVFVGSVEEVYAALPEELRQQLNPLDFRDFVEKLVEVGQADELVDGVFLIKKIGDGTFRVRFS